MLLISATASIALLLYTARTWLDFTGRVAQLRAAIADCELQIDAHTQRLAEVSARSQQVNQGIESVTEEYDATEGRLQILREELPELEDRLERARLKHRRVDLGGDEGEVS